MIAHVVLFRPRPDLSPAELTELVSAIEKALGSIPSVMRAQVGRRIRIGREYEQQMRLDLPYAAIFEFRDVDGLRAYLEHPAHTDVGTAIFRAAAEILIYDFEMNAGADGVRAVATQP